MRHEYFYGMVTAMAGASDEHEWVAGNFFAVLQAHLKGTRCQVFKDGMQLRLPMVSRDLFYYPDVMVACDPTDNHRYYRERPKLTIEVLSEDENKDLVEKFLAYQRLPSLEDYVFLDPKLSRTEARIFRREEGWEPGETWREGTFTLKSVHLDVVLLKLYERSSPLGP